MGVPWWPFVVGTVFMILGHAVTIMAVSVAGWNMALWGWLSARADKQVFARALRLAPLPVLSFPWIPIDCGFLIWWLRLFGAWGMEQCLVLLDVNATRNLTTVTTPYGSFSVIRQCAGINTLQSMTIVGTVLAYLNLRSRTNYWRFLPVIVGVAILTNSIRIVAIGLVGIFIGMKYTEGEMHTWLGWIVVMAVFALLLDYVAEPRLRVRRFVRPSLEDWLPGLRSPH